MLVENFNTKGCERCQKNGTVCTLILCQKSIPQNTPMQFKVFQEPVTVKRERTPEVDPEFEQIQGYVNATNITLEMTTPHFLKERFNFNLSVMREKWYEYLLYSHPKAVIESRLEEDALVYHESGIIVPGLAEEKLKGLKPTKQRHLKSWPHYQLLVLIQAFTLSSEHFHFKYPEIRKLLEIYFFKVNNIFPIIREVEFWSNYNAGIEPTITVFSMILLILRDKLAEEVFREVYLRTRSQLPYKEDEFYESLELFMEALEFKIRQLNMVTEGLGDHNKVNRLVIMLLLSLHYRFDRSGGEQSSEDLTCGINLAFALAIHMKPTKKFFTKGRAEYLADLWWTCYVLDRFNSVINFRCFFIKHEDFNIDLPYKNVKLLKLVQLAKSFENMLVALYQPFNNVHMKDQNNDIQSRLKGFNIAEFQTLEFELCSREIAQDLSKFREIPNLDGLKLYKRNYVDSTIHLLSRLINNCIILVSQKGFFNDPAIHNLIPKKSILRASGNVLWYMKKTPETLMLQSPIIIFCLLVSMSCGLKMRARNVLGTVDKELHDVKPSFEIEGYMLELERFRRGWWVVDDVYKLAQDFIEKLIETEKKRNDIELSMQNSVPTDAVNDQGIRPVSSVTSLLGKLQGAEQESIDPFSVDGSNLFAGWDPSKIEQYDYYFENMQDDLFNIDMFTM